MIHPEVRRFFKLFKYRTEYGIRITAVNDGRSYYMAKLVAPKGYLLGNGRMHTYGMALDDGFRTKIRIWRRA